MKPTRVILGRKGEADIKACVQLALRDGYEVFEEFDRSNSENNAYYIEIGGDHPPYCAPDAVFPRVPSGLYVFRDGRPVYMGDLS